MIEQINDIVGMLAHYGLSVLIMILGMVALYKYLTREL